MNKKITTDIFNKKKEEWRKDPRLFLKEVLGVDSPPYYDNATLLNKNIDKLKQQGGLINEK